LTSLSSSSSHQAIYSVVRGPPLNYTEDGGTHIIPLRKYPHAYNLTYDDIEAYDVCGREYRREIFVMGVIDFVFVQQILNVVIKALLPFLLRRYLCDPCCRTWTRVGRALSDLHFGAGSSHPHQPDPNQEHFHPVPVPQLEPRSGDSEGDDTCSAAEGVSPEDEESRRRRERAGDKGGASERPANPDVASDSRTSTKSSSHLTGVNLPVIVEELGRPDVDSLDDYQEHLSQLAFFAMFPAVMPCMPAIFLIANAVDVRADKFKLCYQFARPIPRAADSIGPILNVFKATLFVSVMANVAVQFLALDLGFSKAFIRRIDETEYTWGITISCLVFVFERLLVAFYQLLQMFLPSTPKHVADHKAKQGMTRRQRQLEASSGTSFRALDTNNDGQVDASEIYTALRARARRRPPQTCNTAAALAGDDL